MNEVDSAMSTGRWRVRRVNIPLARLRIGKHDAAALVGPVEGLSVGNQAIVASNHTYDPSRIAIDERFSVAYS
jgi:hypothetical protein